MCAVPRREDGRIRRVLFDESSRPGDQPILDRTPPRRPFWRWLLVLWFAVLAASWTVRAIVSLVQGNLGTATVAGLFGLSFVLMAYLSLRRHLELRTRGMLAAAAALGLAIALLIEGLGIGRYKEDRVLIALSAALVVAGLGFLLAVLLRLEARAGE